MVIFSKRNIIIPSPDGKIKKFIPKNFVGKVDDWVTATPYFADLVKDGKIVITESTADKELNKAEEKDVVDHTKDNEEKKSEETTEATETTETTEAAETKSRKSNKNTSK